MSGSNSRSSKAIAIALILIGIAYVLLVAYGMASSDQADRSIDDRIRILMEVATIISALLFVLFVGSVYQENTSYFVVMSLVLMSVMFATTSVCHWASITVGARLIDADPVFRKIISLEWPSVLATIDIFAWDFVFGLSMIFLGLAIRGRKKYAASLMILSGILSMIGLVAIPLNNMNYRFIGVAGYTIVPIIACSSYAYGKVQG